MSSEGSSSGRGGLFGGLLRGRGESAGQEPQPATYQQATGPAEPSAAEEEMPLATDATQTDEGAYLTWEERFGGLISTRQSRRILAVSVGAIAALFVLFLCLGSGDSSTGHGPSSPTTGQTNTKPTMTASSQKRDNAPVGSPTDPNPVKREAGCPALGNAPPGRRYIAIKNNCKEPIWPGIIPAGAALPPGNSWLWKQGECKTLTVASSLPSLRVWARTGCDKDYKCRTGTCRTEGNGGCASAGEAPCSLFEATLQDHCTATPRAGMGPDFFDISLVDGFNVNFKATVSGGFNVGQVAGAFSCQTPVANPFDYEACPYELRVYADAIPGTTLPVEGWNGKNLETSPCFKTPLNETCRQSVIGCRSLCKALDQGWIGYYIDNVQGDTDLIDPTLTRPTGQKVRWSEQFKQGRSACGPTLCRDVPAWGAYRGSTYGSHGLMRNLVCCDAAFRCSPYQPNNVPGGCPYDQACPTLGSADPASPFHGQRTIDDKGYPQFDEEIRKSSSEPDWPLPTKGAGYAKIYKDSSPSAYSWQYNDASSTYVCCGKEGDTSKPSYILTFCPSE